MLAPLRVIFMGTPEFATHTLQALHDNPDVATVVAVYTQPDRPAGRGQKLTPPPVKELALKLGYPVFQPENINTPDEKRKLADFFADVFVVVAYAQFLSDGVLNIPRGGCVNVHGSLLPKYRGAAPIQYTVLNGEKEAGITTMKLVKKMDAGPMLLQKAVPITEETTSKDLFTRLAPVGADLLVETIRAIRDGTVEEKPQDEALVSYAKLIKKEDGEINWNESGTLIMRKIRAFDPWPGTYTKSSKGNIKIHKARYHSKLDGSPGNAHSGDLFMGVGSLFVRCLDGWIELLVVQPENKKPLFSQDFLNGIKNEKEFKIS